MSASASGHRSCGCPPRFRSSTCRCRSPCPCIGRETWLEAGVAEVSGLGAEQRRHLVEGRGEPVSFLLPVGLAVGFAVGSMLRTVVNISIMGNHFSLDSLNRMSPDLRLRGWRRRSRTRRPFLSANHPHSRGLSLLPGWAGTPRPPPELGWRAG